MLDNRLSGGNAEIKAASAMRNTDRRMAYAGVWILALAFGFIEACVVVYLREIYLREVSLHGDGYFAGLQMTLVSLPNQTVALEMVREACTIALLAAAGWLAGRRTADRAGAFLLAFGVWDLTYYASLYAVAGWPDTLRAWDILFLIPLPWVAPVWAPMTVAGLFVAAGTYLFFTADRERRYGWSDAAVLGAAAALTVAAFMVESGAAVDHREPQSFPVWLFWAGVALGVLWFVRAERRARGVDRGADSAKPWVGVTVRTVVDDETADVPQLTSAYADARRTQDALREQSAALDRSMRIADWRVEQLREQLVLRGRGDLVDDSELFFH